MTEEAESVLLRDLGVSGSAIRLNLRQNERWRRERSALLERFRPQVEEIKREFSDHLRRVTPRAKCPWAQATWTGTPTWTHWRRSASTAS